MVRGKGNQELQEGWTCVRGGQQALGAERQAGEVILEPPDGDGGVL